MADHAEYNLPAICQQAVDLTRNSIEEVKKRLSDFDTTNSFSEKASQYLSTAVDKTQAALADLGHVAEQLKSGPAEIPVQAITRGLASVQAAYTLVQDTAKQYDEQHQLSSHISAIVSNPREQALAALATMGAYAAHASDVANAQLQGVSDGLRAKLAEAATAGLDKALPPVAKADEMFHVSEAAAATMAMLVKTAKELEEKFGVSGYLQGAADMAQSLDQKVTKGKVTPIILAAYKRGVAMIGIVQHMYADKKTEMKRSEAPSS